MKIRNKKKTRKLVNTVKKETTLAGSSIWRTDSEKGAALVVALLILLLLMGFAAFAISRVTTETVITGNDSSESKAYAVATGGLDLATQEIASELNQSITSPSLNVIKAAAERGVKTSGALPDNYTITTDASPYGSSCQPVEITEGPHSGLMALRDAYRLDVTARDARTEAEVQLTRTFYNDRIPLFQFGQFAEYSLNFMSGPEIYRGGRVHTNGNMFIWGPNQAGEGAYFTDEVTVVGEIVNTHNRLGGPIPNRRKNKIYVKNPMASMAAYLNNPKANSTELNTGQASTICGNVSVSDNIFKDSSFPGLSPAQCSENPSCIRVSCKQRPAWETNSNNTGEGKFGGGLDANIPPLQMPLFQLEGAAIEIIKRGKSVGDKANVNGSVIDVTEALQDTVALSHERFANKPGIRISLSDSKQRLPGCAKSTNGDNDCGVRLDGDLKLSDGTKASVGYKPRAMQDGYQATTFNATRFAYPNYIPSSEYPGLWIKVETVDQDGNTLDITEDFLSLGITEHAPPILGIDGYGNTDSRSIIKLQRFSIHGDNIENDGGNAGFLTYNKRHNYVRRYRNKRDRPYTGDVPGSCNDCRSGDDSRNPWSAPTLKSSSSSQPPFSPRSSSLEEDNWHLKWAPGRQDYIVPFPIKLFDTRESTGFGIFDKSRLADREIIISRYENEKGKTKTLHSSGVMSLVDIDVGNLRRFFNKEFDAHFPTNTPYTRKKGGTTLISSDIPSARGWVLYISDRRGDMDFDGKYNEDASLEGPRVPTKDDKDWGEVSRSKAAVSDHQYYRRGVRLINAEKLPGIYNSATNPCVKGDNDTHGFTVASENMVYVRGNYNADGSTVGSGNTPTTSLNYTPLNDANHIPAAIVADEVATLSNDWKDPESFIHPYHLMSAPGRPANQVGRVVTLPTQYRFAMISGYPSKRVLENWKRERQSYSGSFVWMFMSQHGKPSEYPNREYRLIYNPPTRDWTFEESFLELTRLPPGTPYLSSISLTGFQRVND